VSSFLKYKLRRDRRVAELDINLIVRLGCDAGAEKPYSGFECQYLSQTTEFYFNKQHRQSGKVVNVVKGLSSGAEKLFAVSQFSTATPVSLGANSFFLFYRGARAA
jgi:hypothetical protein